MNEATIMPGGYGRVEKALFNLIDVEVQHDGAHGAPTNDKGTVGLAVVTLPTGQPRIVMRTTHADGTTLDVMLPTAAHSATLIDMLSEASGAAQAIADAAKSAPRQ